MGPFVLILKKMCLLDPIFFTFVNQHFGLRLTCTNSNPSTKYIKSNHK